jgi:hypothetical protein
MSPELETLDQLAGGDMSLAVIRRLYPDVDRFVMGVSGLLAAGDVKLLSETGEVVPRWRWRELLGKAPEGVVLALTAQGVARVS